MGVRMGFYIAYIIAAICILFPRRSGVVIAELLDQISKRKYGAASEEDKQVRPVFSVLVGLVILFLTSLIRAKNM